MKKTLLFITFIATAFVSCGVHQKVGNAWKLSEGMTKEQVVEILGLPIKQEFERHVDEWHYCRTGISTDEFLSLFFYENKLIALKNYTVTTSDVPGAYGSCENFIKRGTYSIPDVVGMFYKLNC